MPLGWTRFLAVTRRGGAIVSIVRVGLAETQKFAEGYEAIFGKKSSGTAPAKKARPAKGRAAPRKPAKKVKR